MDLVVAVYELTEPFPTEELYGLISQMRRASVSIASNIAEGRLWGSEKEFVLFLRIAYSSGGELETQIEISKRRSKTKHNRYDAVDMFLEEVMKMLHTLLKTVSISAHKN